MNNREVFERDGVVIVRDVFDKQRMEALLQMWKDYAISTQRTINRWNPVEWEIDYHMPMALAYLYLEERLLDAVETVIGPNICLYNRRFVVKDVHATGPVHLHQDSCYHKGNLNKLSAFVPLTQMTPANGGLNFYLGSHKMGFLGDAGAIAREHATMFECISPVLNPGDVALMHSHCWHDSGPNTTSEDRVIADIHYQPSDDPTGVALLRGKWLTDVRMPYGLRTQPFERSRVSRLKELQNIVDQQISDAVERATFYPKLGDKHES